MPLKAPVRPLFAFLAVCLIWGSTFTLIRIGLHGFPAPWLVCLRYLSGGIALLGLTAARKEAFPSRRDIATHFKTGFLLLFAGNSIVYWAAHTLSAGVGGVLMATSPFWMVLLAAIFPPREPVSARIVLGLSAGFLGLIWMLSPHWGASVAAPGESRFWVSVACVLVMNVFWAAGSLYARRSHTSTSILMSAGLQNLSAGLLLIPFCLPSLNHLPAWPPPIAWAALGTLTLLGTVVATPCYFYMLKKLPVNVSCTFAYAIPVVSMLLGHFTLGEPFQAATIGGASVILASLAFLQKSYLRAEPVQSA